MTDMPAPQVIDQGNAAPMNVSILQETAAPTALQLEDEKLRLVVFGDPGTGKTTLASTFPKPLFLDTDAGMVSVALAGRAAERFEPTSYKDLEYLYRLVREHGDSYETIVIDSWTELQRMLLDEIVDEGAAKDAGNMKKIFVPEQIEYLANQRQMHRLLHSFRRLGKHIILTAGVRDKLGQRVPSMSPGLLEIVNHWASVLAELIVYANEDGMPERYLVFQPSAARMAKSRFWALGSHVRIPDMRTEKDQPTAYEIIQKGVADSYAHT